MTYAIEWLIAKGMFKLTIYTRKCKAVTGQIGINSNTIWNYNFVSCLSERKSWWNDSFCGVIFYLALGTWNHIMGSDSCRDDHLRRNVQESWSLFRAPLSNCVKKNVLNSRHQHNKSLLKTKKCSLIDLLFVKGYISLFWQ